MISKVVERAKGSCIMTAASNVKTLADLEAQPRKVLSQIRRSSHPVLITKAGKPDLIIMNASAYERQIHIRHLEALLAEAEADLRAGRVRPFEEFMREFERAHKIPSDRRRKRRA